MNRQEFLKSSLKACAGLGMLCGCARQMTVNSTADAVTSADTEPTGSSLVTASPGKPFTPAEERVAFAGGWTKRFFDLFEEMVDEETRLKLMEMNGKACFNAYHQQDKRKKTPQLGIEEYVRRLAEYVGEENCYIEGSTIHYSYVENPNGLKNADGYCLCPVLEDGPKDIAPSYCHCSVGYVKAMFGRFLNEEPEVELLESILRGGKRCRFAIHLRDAGRQVPSVGS